MCLRLLASPVVRYTSLSLAFILPSSWKPDGGLGCLWVRLFFIYLSLFIIFLFEISLLREEQNSRNVSTLSYFYVTQGLTHCIKATPLNMSLRCDPLSPPPIGKSLEERGGEGRGARCRRAEFYWFPQTLPRNLPLMLLWTRFLLHLEGIHSQVSIPWHIFFPFALTNLAYTSIIVFGSGGWVVVIVVSGWTVSSVVTVAVSWVVVLKVVEWWCFFPHLSPVRFLHIHTLKCAHSHENIKHTQTKI